VGSSGESAVYARTDIINLHYVVLLSEGSVPVKLTLQLRLTHTFYCRHLLLLFITT
jgi:hypothetical protein